MAQYRRNNQALSSFQGLLNRSFGTLAFHWQLGRSAYALRTMRSRFSAYALQKDEVLILNLDFRDRFAEGDVCR